LQPSAKGLAVRSISSGRRDAIDITVPVRLCFIRTTACRFEPPRALNSLARPLSSQCRPFVLPFDFLLVAIGKSVDSAKRHFEKWPSGFRNKMMRKQRL